MQRRYVVFVSLVIVSLVLTSCGPGQLLGPTLTPVPTHTPTPLPPTATPTPAGISEAEIAYFRGMLTASGASEMMNLEPPTELLLLHIELVAKRRNWEVATDAMSTAALTADRLTFMEVQARADAAFEAYLEANERARLTWQQYLSRYGLELSAVERMHP